MSKESLPLAGNKAPYSKYAKSLIVEKCHERAIIPRRQTENAAGYDLFPVEKYRVESKKTLIISTGIKFGLPVGTVGLIRGRSGYAFKSALFVFEGTIDQDYQGEVKVLVQNNSEYPIDINNDKAIAQLVIVNISMPEIIVTSKGIEEIMGVTNRGTKGFGSTDSN